MEEIVPGLNVPIAIACRVPFQVWYAVSVTKEVAAAANGVVRE
jgi:hypothetical protein